MKKNIIFLFSLPRSGSTLLQRILAIHPEIYTTAEPWLLLPFFYSLKESGLYAEYNMKVCNKALIDFIGQLPNKNKTYYQAINNFASSLYQQSMDENSKYFLDKTPRYYLIIDHILNAFPNAKYIFLFRNPLHVFSSILTTWHMNKFKYGRNYIDLFKGPKLLVSGLQKIKNSSMVVNYEKLISNPNDLLIDLLEYLELDSADIDITKFKDILFPGKLGDPTGQFEYNNITQKPLEKYKTFFNSNFRKKKASEYLSHLTTNVIDEMGYDYDALQNQLSDIKTTNKISINDHYNYILDMLWRFSEFTILKSNTKELLSSKRKFYCHT